MASVMKYLTLPRRPHIPWWVVCSVCSILLIARAIYWIWQARNEQSMNLVIFEWDRLLVYLIGTLCHSDPAGQYPDNWNSVAGVIGLLLLGITLYKLQSGSQWSNLINILIAFKLVTQWAGIQFFPTKQYHWLYEGKQLTGLFWVGGMSFNNTSISITFSSKGLRSHLADGLWRFWTCSSKCFSCRPTHKS